LGLVVGSISSVIAPDVRKAADAATPANVFTLAIIAPSFTSFVRMVANMLGVTICSEVSMLLGVLALSIQPSHDVRQVAMANTAIDICIDFIFFKVVKGVRELRS